MTSPTTPPVGAGFPSAERKPLSFSIARVLLFSIAMTLLITFELYCHYTVFDSFHADLLEAEHKSSAWIEQQLSFALPFITICLFQYLTYRAHDREDGIAQAEMAWEIGIVTVLVYGVLLPVVAHMSRSLHKAALDAGETFPTTAAGVDQTLLLTVMTWFIRLGVPLLLLLVYHAEKSARERRDAMETACRRNAVQTCHEVPAV